MTDGGVLSGQVLAAESIAALVPAYNEAGRVGATVTALAAIPGVSTILVVDDGSTDATAAEAAAAGAVVISTGGNLGKGGAVRRGLEVLGVGQPAPPAPATALTPPAIVLFIDGDVGASASEAAALLAPVTEGRADMTIGVFPRRRDGKGGFGLARNFATWSIRRLTGREVYEPLSGQRAVRSTLMGSIHVDDGYGMETGMTIDAARAGARITEVPVEMSHARTGRDLAGFMHRGRQLAAIISAVIRRSWRRGGREAA